MADWRSSPRVIESLKVPHITRTELEAQIYLTGLASNTPDDIAADPNHARGIIEMWLWTRILKPCFLMDHGDLCYELHIGGEK